MSKLKTFNSANPMPKEIFSQMYEILEYSFPKTERRSRKGHLSELNKPLFRSLVLLEDEKVQGFMNYWDLSEFVYLEHFAIAKELRGQGVGSRLMSELRSSIENRPIILEVEPPQQSDIAARRIKFYERLGFVLNEYPYLQPPYENDEPLPLAIMSTERKLDPNEFKKIKFALYRNVYNVPENSELYK